MKKMSFTVLLLFLELTACKITSSDSGDTTKAQTKFTLTDYSRPILIDTANRMIQSYLDGINYTVNTQEVRSLIFDADVLRNYINDTTQGIIKNVKFIFAHTLDYIHSGHEGQRPDTNNHALTMIIVGVDQNGNYVYTPDNKAMDFLQPCPPQCYDEGDAVNDLLVAP